MTFHKGQDVALVHEQTVKAVLHVEELFEYDVDVLAQKIFGDSHNDHKSAAKLKLGSPTFLSGKIDMLESALIDRNCYELTPSDTRLIFEQMGWRRIAGFHTRSIPNRAHEYIIRETFSNYHCEGMFVYTDAGHNGLNNDNHEITIGAWRYLSSNHLPPDTIITGSFPSYPAQVQSHREILLSAICQKNFGCNMLVASYQDLNSESSTWQADKKTLLELSKHIGIEMVLFDEIYYCDQCDLDTEKCSHGGDTKKAIRSQDVLGTLKSGQFPPEWQLRKDVGDLVSGHFKA